MVLWKIRCNLCMKTYVLADKVAKVKKALKYKWAYGVKQEEQNYNHDTKPDWLS